MNNDKTSRYFDAAQYACEILGDDAPRYFPRLHQLSRYNSLPELKSIVDGWRPVAAPAPPAPGLWMPGSAWGSAVRVERARGIFWQLRCACGNNFKLSTNDSVPDERRKCSTCLLADEMSEANQATAARLKQTSATVLAWHRTYEKLIWDRVHRALRKRNLEDADFARELAALVWVKITQNANKYRDEGFKVSTWLCRVADNCIKDFFKVRDNRERLAPTVPLMSEDSRDAAAPPARAEETLPARPVRPDGASPTESALNPKQGAWDSAQSWNG